MPFKKVMITVMIRMIIVIMVITMIDSKETIWGKETWGL